MRRLERAAQQIGSYQLSFGVREAIILAVLGVGAAFAAVSFGWV